MVLKTAIEYREKLTKYQTRAETLQNDVTNTNKKIKYATRNIRHYEQALEVVKYVGMETQKQFEYHINSITSLALRAVFSKKYDLKLKFVDRRGKTECDIVIVDGDGNEQDPLMENGGSVGDIVAFALRVALYSLQQPRTVPVIIQDEPLRFLNSKSEILAAEMMKELSQKIGLQFIMVTHSMEFTQIADKKIEIKQVNGISKKV